MSTLTYLVIFACSSAVSAADFNKGESKNDTGINVGSKVGNPISNVGNNVTDITNNIETQFKDVLDQQVGQNAENQVNNLIDQIGDNIGKQLDNAADKIGKQLDNAADKIGKQLDNAADKIENKIGDVIEDAEKKAKELIGEIPDLIDKGIDFIKEEINGGKSSSSILVDDIKFEPGNPFNTTDYSKVRILSLDGGGVKGIVQIVALAAIEEKTGKPISQLFDVMGGTSVGALITTMLALKDKDDPTKPRFSAKELLELMRVKAPLMFSKKAKSSSSGWSCCGKKATGGYKPKYDNQPLVDLLKETVGVDHRFTSDNFLTNVFALSYDDMSGEPVLFKSWEPVVSETGTVLIATTAAPGFFYPKSIRSYVYDEDGNKEQINRKLWDGAISANNPAQIIDNEISQCVEIGVLKGLPLKRQILSLGTGSGAGVSIEGITNAKLMNIGKIVKDLQEIATSSQSKVVDTSLKKTYGVDYLRLSPEGLDSGKYPMDSNEKKKILELEKISADYLQTRKIDFDMFVESLLIKDDETVIKARKEKETMLNQITDLSEKYRKLSDEHTSTQEQVELLQSKHQAEIQQLRRKSIEDIEEIQKKAMELVAKKNKKHHSKKNEKKGV